MEPWRVHRSEVADSYNFDEEQDPDPHWSDGMDPDPLKVTGWIRIQIRIKVKSW